MKGYLTSDVNGISKVKDLRAGYCIITADHPDHPPGDLDYRFRIFFKHFKFLSINVRLRKNILLASRQQAPKRLANMPIRT
jgi:hypothetical protein